MLQSTRQILPSDIPLLCDYALFTADGQRLSGSIEPEDSSFLWKICMENGQTGDPRTFTLLSIGNFMVKS